MGDFGLSYDSLMFESFVKERESLRLRMYRDTVGFLTIGWGHNLDANPITERAAQVIVEDDIDVAKRELVRHLPWVTRLDPVRQFVLTDMSFNMGMPTLLNFKNTLGYIERGEFERAAQGMRHSLWYRQTGNRAKILVRMMETGQWNPRID